MRFLPLNSRYHSGELEAQRRAGVRDLADRVGRIIRPTIPPAAREFLAAQSMIIAATNGSDGAVHASALFGAPGFVQATGERSLELHPSSGHLQTVFGDLAVNDGFGMLAIEFAARRRMRANGRAAANGSTIRLTTYEVYSNCPQHIVPRETPHLEVGGTRAAARLTDPQRRWIESADTFFIASAHPENGPDASHRGGAPGFLRAGDDRISWPDYPGNAMFNTIGNLLVNPRCGLLFIDFERGATMQIEGTASVRWEGEGRVEVRVDRCLESEPAGA